MSYGTKYQKNLQSSVNVSIHDIVIPVEVVGASVKAQMNARAYEKMMHWVDKAEHSEVSGLGMVECKNGIFQVSEVFLLPQENGATSTDIEPEDMAKLMFETKDLPGELRFWWHSHVKMETFWSGTDMDTMKELAKGGWFLSMVVNQKRARRTAFLSMTPELFIDEMSTEIVAPNHNELIAEWNKEYDSKVKKKTYSYLGTGKGSSWCPQRKTKEERRALKEKKATNGGTKNGGGGAKSHLAVCQKTGIQELGKYQFYIEDIEGVQDSDGPVTMYATDETIFKGFHNVWYKPKNWTTGAWTQQWLDIETIAKLCREYLEYISDPEAKVIFDNELSQAQLELLDDWDQYVYWDEVDGEEAKKIYEHQDRTQAIVRGRD